MGFWVRVLPKQKAGEASDKKGLEQRGEMWLLEGKWKAAGRRPSGLKLQRDIPCFMCKVIMSFLRQSFTDLGIIQLIFQGWIVRIAGGGGRGSLPNAKLGLHMSTRQSEGYKGPRYSRQPRPFVFAVTVVFYVPGSCYL